MVKVEDLLARKPRALYAIGPDEPVLEAIRMMAEHSIGAVLVLRDGAIAGIVSERDYARKVVLIGRSSRDSAVSEVMTHAVVCVAPDRSINECMALMTGKRLRHLPVLDHKHIMGLVSIGDLVKATIAEQEFTITQLQKYVTG